MTIISDPRSIINVGFTAVNLPHMTMDQGSVLEVVCIKLLLSSQHNQKLSRDSYY